VDGAGFDVTVSPGKGAPKIESIEPQPGAVEAPSGAKGEPLNAPLAGNIFKVLVNPGDQVAKGMTLIVLEAMKMETEVRTPRDATVTAVEVKEGDTIESGSVLVYLA
jgi:oxaloacetate decarboxylase alpha subunit